MFPIRSVPDNDVKKPPMFVLKDMIIRHVEKMLIAKLFEYES